jgi:general secretion pathway protein C
MFQQWRGGQYGAAPAWHKLAHVKKVKRNRMKRLPLYMSFIAVVALSVSLAYWALQLFKAPERTISAPPPQSAPPASLEAAAGLFGGQPVAVAVSNYQLRGVVASERGRDSVAVLSFDGKPAKAYPVGAQVVQGVTVQQVQPRFVLLSEGGVVKRVDLAADTGPSAGTGGPTPQAPARTPIPVPTTTPTPPPPTASSRMQRPQSPVPNGVTPPGPLPGQQVSTDDDPIARRNAAQAAAERGSATQTTVDPGQRRPPSGQ